MKVAMMQPTFLPWQGFFELIFQSDIFVVLDDFQFSVQSYHQRNRLFVSPGKSDWYTVPVVKAPSYGAPLNRCVIDQSGFWRKKMIQRFKHNYGKAPFFEDVFPGVENILQTDVASLAELNILFIRYVLELFQWNKDVRFSSALASELTRSERVVEILAWCNASRYFSAAGSFGYMREDGIFPLQNLDVCFQNFQCQPYQQVGSATTFVPYLSIFDALLNAGPKETAARVSSGTKNWRSWDDMVAVAEKTFDY
jgi:hypothetical protein